MSHPRFTKIAVVSVAILVVLVSIGILTPFHKRLEEESQAIGLPLQSVSLIGYDWLNPNELIYLVREKGSQRIMKFDSLTGSSLGLDIPTAALQESGRRIQGGPPFKISPDNAELLMREEEPIAESLIAVNLSEPSWKRVVLANDESYVSWVPDGTGLMKFARRGNHSEARIIYWKRKNGAETNQLPVIIRYPFLYRNSDETLLTATQSGRSLEIVTLKITQKLVLSKTKIQLLNAEDPLEPTFSPNGLWLAWTSRVEGRIKPKLLARFPFISFYREWTYYLRVANIRTGQVDTRKASNALWGLKWIPDSEAVSFFSGEHLYLFQIH